MIDDAWFIVRLVALLAWTLLVFQWGRLYGKEEK